MFSFLLQSGFVLLTVALAIGFFVATYQALRRWRGGWRLAALLPLLGVIAVVVTIVVEVGADPTAHNLWPFEVLGGVIVAGAVLGGMQLMRLIAQRWVGRAHSR
jgi:hypothetical protein